jgi:hypothetical protein
MESVAAPSTSASLLQIEDTDIAVNRALGNELVIVYKLKFIKYNESFCRSYPKY